MDGICTLANDRVYDQLVALLNSIEAILGPEMPVCIYPYDDNTAQISTEIAQRQNVSLYNDQDSIQQWDQFVRDVWDAHPTAHEHWRQIGSELYHRVGTHRRYCAFDGPFDRFVYMDADTLLMGAVEPIFEQLSKNDWVVYDFQYTDPAHVYNLSAERLAALFTPEQIQANIFCSGFYAAKKGMFNIQQREWLLEQLRAGEADVLYPMAPDQTMLNYMVMRMGISSYNFAHHLPPGKSTGCCVTSTHFVEREHVLYDKGNRLTYLHYIGLSSKLFSRLGAGENIDFPYRDLFLYYRYLHEPEKRPKFITKPKPYNAPPSLGARVLRKLGLAH